MSTNNGHDFEILTRASMIGVPSLREMISRRNSVNGTRITHNKLAKAVVIATSRSYTYVRKVYGVPAIPLAPDHPVLLLSFLASFP